MNSEMLALILVGLAVCMGLGVGSVGYLYFFRLWFRTHVAQCSMSLSTIIGLFFRGSSPQLIVNSYIDLHKGGLSVTVEELEAHYKATGNVRLVARAMVAAKVNGRDVDFATACAIDLDGKDVMKEIGLDAVLSATATD